MAKQTGRVLQCSTCSASPCQVTTQVFRKIVFRFCAVCWFHRRDVCNGFMRKVAA